MSIKTIGQKAKSAASDLTSTKGLKSMAMHLAIGAGLGAIVALVMHYIQLFVINKYAAAYSKVTVFSIYPNSGNSDLYVEDIVLIIASAAMLFTKKLWLTVGFVLGWYGSNYMGFYSALKLPEPTP